MLSGVRRETGWFLRCGESISPGLCFKTIQLGKGRFKCRVRSGDVPWEVQRHPPGRGEWGFCCYLWFGFFLQMGKGGLLRNGEVGFVLLSSCSFAVLEYQTEICGL